MTVPPFRDLEVLSVPASSGVVGRGRGGTASPHFFRQGGRVPHSPHVFWTEIRAKLSPLLQPVTYRNAM